MTAPLVARGVQVDLAGSPVVRGVDLHVAQGEFVTILGANGSGKSTLVRALVGLTPARGTIELFGQPLHKLRDRSKLGYVAQRPSATTGVPVTVTELVTSGLLPRRPKWGFASRSDRERIRAAIDAVGLSHKSRSAVSRLSGGQQQRAHIARALVSDPQLLVMDEPTAGVDYESVEVLANLLGDLLRRDTAILMVAHELGALRPLIDRSVVIQDGLVSYNGPVNEQLDAQHRHDHLHDSEPAHINPVPSEGPWT